MDVISPVRETTILKIESDVYVGWIKYETLPKYEIKWEYNTQRMYVFMVIYLIEVVGWKGTFSDTT